MTIAAQLQRSSGRKRNPAAIVMSAAAILALALSYRSLARELPPDRWLEALWLSGSDDLQAMIVHYTILPRMTISVLAGAALALSGTIFQQVLRNPLAEASTLGVSAGAYLALSLATLWLPALALDAPEAVALAGAAAALLVAGVLAWRGGPSPLRFILAGLIVSLFCGVVTSVLALFHHETLRSVFIWGSGSLVQNDWSSVVYLLPRFAAILVVAAVLVRPLSLLSLEEEGARALGLAVAGIQSMGLLLAVALAAFVVSAVGVIGFIGIAAPALVRLAGARTFRGRLVAAPLMGGVLLWLADQLTQINPFTPRELPTGIVTAVLGGLLLLWMLPRLRSAPPVLAARLADTSKRQVRPWLLAGIGMVILALAVWMALAFGQNAAGWHWSGYSGLQPLLEWRGPRVMAALAAGAMLAMAGTLMQRMTGNAMASPEILGISSGACLGVILLFLSGVAPGHGLKILAASGGAFATLTLMLTLARRSAYSPERMVLTGVALGTGVGALLALFMVSGDPRMGSLLAWMAGSTYAVTLRDALSGCVVALILIAVMPLAARWLDILPLGETAARELGVDLARSRLAILVATAILTGAATLIVGPLSFVGLMAPHMARMAGFHRALPQLAGSAVLGALIMV
ncbi:Fe(3+)-hydroxamate ABC transporter permease FhuB, partial [Pseudochelatococcus sp. B33]